MSDLADLDVTDESRVRAAVADLGPGVIVNCAAYNAVDAEDDAGGQRVRRPVAGARRGGDLRVESLFGGVDGPGADGRRPGGSLDRIAGALLAGREVRAFVDRVVSPSHVDDVAAATLALVRTAAPHGLYHCVGSGHATWLEVAAALAGEPCARTTSGSTIGCERSSRASRIDQRLATLERVAIPAAEPAE